MAKKNRSGCLIIATLGIVGVAIVYSVPEGVPERTPVETTVPALPEKPGVPYLVINKGEPFPTQHLAPPTELHVFGVTEAECDQMGGTYFAPRTTCLDVNY